MRYHEFFRFEDGQIVEMQALWDIPQVMMQAGAWPMSPSLAVEWVVPGPATNDGIVTDAYDEARSQASLALVRDMLVGLKRNVISVAAMELDKYWHPNFMWYGPAGLGSMRRISGFRNWHQIPFLKAMPDRDAFLGKGIFFGDGEYVGFTGWPGMKMDDQRRWLAGDRGVGSEDHDAQPGFLALREWLDPRELGAGGLLHVYEQIGVDVFERMRELTVARHGRIQV